MAIFTLQHILHGHINQGFSPSAQLGLAQQGPTGAESSPQLVDMPGLWPTHVLVSPCLLFPYGLGYPCMAFPHQGTFF